MELRNGMEREEGEEGIRRKRKIRGWNKGKGMKGNGGKER